MNDINPGKQLLIDVADVVYNDRRHQYGSAVDEMERISRIWSALLGHPIEPIMVPLFMTALKLVREAYKHKRDSLIDAIGYLTIAEEVAVEQGS